MTEGRIISVAQAIREATDLAMARDNRVYIVGEGVADPKGIFGTTGGLLDKYGPERVVEMPISENGMTGVAIGSAIGGQRPIMVHQRVDFALLAMEQLVNNAAKARYVSSGHHKVPMVVRMIIGRGWGQGPAHSQSLETLFAYLPGLKLVMPATAYEAKGLLIAAIEDDNPVIFLEHRWVHYSTGRVPEGWYSVPLTGSRNARPGTDLTIVATSYMLFEALLAARYLAEAGLEAEVIDLMIARPLNMAPIVASVAKTGRLLTVDTGFTTLGLGAEIVARCVENAFTALRSPPARLGLPDHPTPSSRELVRGYYPVSLDIFDKAASMTGVASERLATARARLAAEREKVPFDVPYPAFRGPF
jgi:pyruvate/2-oxoglutarate/acetoin dehydrogenase E1 component